jgi:hypothetical protein
MTTIKATCPTCGDVDLAPADVVVTIAPELGWSTYTFLCQRCARPVSKPADEEVVQLLTGAGVRVQRLDPPDEYLQSRVMLATGPAMTGDDVLDFALWMAGTDDIVGALLHD